MLRITTIYKNAKSPNILYKKLTFGSSIGQ